jgi:hypothetical protein
LTGGGCLPSASNWLVIPFPYFKERIQKMNFKISSLAAIIAAITAIIAAYSNQIVTLTAERDLFKKETVALASASLRYQSALDQIASSIPASRQNTPISYLQGIAKEALEI